jgi:uncharacterized protein Usg
MKMLRYRLLDFTILFFFQTYKIGGSLPSLNNFIDFQVFSSILHV